MSFPNSSLFQGTVSHQRITPIRHKLSYSVFSLLIDLNQIEEFSSKSFLFSYNKWNLLSLFTKDYGDGKQQELAEFATHLLKTELPNIKFEYIMLLTYPRVLGYVFNPLSVYVFLDSMRQPVAAIYEVSNTFSGRTNYVCKIEDKLIDQAEKDMVVSPFNGTHGRYSFRLKFDNENISIGVALRENDVPIINTWYNCSRTSTNDFKIIWLLVKKPFMTFKVIAGIHFEAAKLWLKGLRPPKRSPS